MISFLGTFLCQIIYRSHKQILKFTLYRFIFGILCVGRRSWEVSPIAWFNDLSAEMMLTYPSEINPLYWLFMNRRPKKSPKQSPANIIMTTQNHSNISVLKPTHTQRKFQHNFNFRSAPLSHLICLYFFPKGKENHLYRSPVFSLASQFLSLFRSVLPVMSASKHGAIK